MPVQANTPRFRIARALQQIFSPYAISTETLVGAIVPIGLANLVLDFGREEGGFGIWLLITSCGYLAMLIIPVLIRTFAPGKVFAPWFYALVFVAAGVLRGLTIYAIGTEAGVIKPEEWQYRLLGSPLFVFVTLSLVTVLVSNSVRASNELADLEISRLALQQRLTSMRAEIARMNAEVAGRVSGLISPVIQQLMANLKGAKADEIGREIKALRSTVDDVVRPLSLDIAGTSEELTDVEIAAPRVSLREDFKLSTKIQVANQILPLWSTVLMVLVATPAAVSFYNAEAFVALGLFALASLIVLEIFVVLLRRIVLITVPALMVQFAVFAVSGFAASTSLGLFTSNNEQYPVGRIVMLSLVIGLAVFIGQVRQTQRAATQQSAREVNAQLELLNSQARRELWLNRRRIATVLHGPVQAALYASAMRLAQAARPSSKLIQTVNKDLENALEVLKFDSIESPNLREVLRQIVDVWAGSCEIYLNVSKDVMKVTKKNALLSEALVEVLREAISNAIKHGQATEIEVDARLADNLIEIAILNNGKAPVNKAGKGFGSKLYDELTHSWELNEKSDGRTEFGATIFVA
ncbi:MAG: hypothetical protein RL149_893 [Actinomycetota bacterium]